MLIVPAALLLGVSTKLRLVWRSMPPRRQDQPDYSQLIEGLAAVSLGIDVLVVQLRHDPQYSANVGKLVRSQTLVEQATELLLKDLRERGLA